jgi:hypothetical protein
MYPSSAMELQALGLKATITFLEEILKKLTNKDLMSRAVLDREAMIKKMGGTDTQYVRLDIADSEGAFDSFGRLTRGLFQLQQPSRFTNDAFKKRGLLNSDLSDRERVALDSAIDVSDYEVREQFKALLCVDPTANFQDQLEQQLIISEYLDKRDRLLYKLLTNSNCCYGGICGLQRGYSISSKLIQLINEKIDELILQLHYYQAAQAKMENAANKDYPALDLRLSNYNQVTKKEVNQKFERQAISPRYYHKIMLHVSLKLDQDPEAYKKVWEDIVLEIVKEPCVYGVKFRDFKPDPKRVQDGKEITLYFLDPKDMQVKPVNELAMLEEHLEVIKKLDSLIRRHYPYPSITLEGEVLAGGSLGCVSRAIYLTLSDQDKKTHDIKPRTKHDFPEHFRVYSAKENIKKALILIEGFLNLLPETRGTSQLKALLQDKAKHPRDLFADVLALVDVRLNTLTRFFFQRDERLHAFYREVVRLRSMDPADRGAVENFRVTVIQQFVRARHVEVVREVNRPMRGSN